MARRTVVSGLMCVAISLAVCAFAGEGVPAEKTDKAKVCVGTFDSRAVAVACAHSSWNDKRLKAKMAEMEQAKAEGDTKKIEELEEWGKAQQAKLHRQGFGTADVDDLLKYIEDKIPGIARQTGVDIIVSKWDVVYQRPSAKLVDITDEMVKAFEPDQKTLKTIKDLSRQQPVEQEVLEQMHCEKPGKK